MAPSHNKSDITYQMPMVSHYNDNLSRLHPEGSRGSCALGELDTESLGGTSPIVAPSLDAGAKALRFAVGNDEVSGVASSPLPVTRPMFSHRILCTVLGVSANGSRVIFVAARTALQTSCYKIRASRPSASFGRLLTPTKVRSTLRRLELYEDAVLQCSPISRLVMSR